MTELTLRVAIIGCGEVTRNLHLPWLHRLQRNGHIQVVAFIDSVRARAQALSDTFPNCATFDSVDEAVSSRPADITLVASPPGLHVDHCLAVIAGGSHVLVEKPMTTSRSAAKALIEAAAAHRKIVAVGFPRRFFPAVAEVAAILSADEIGPETSFVYREGSVYSWTAATSAPFQRAVSGGGVLLDKGVHALDTLEQLFGPGSVIRAEDDSLAGGVESNATLELSYPRSRGRLQLSWDQTLNNGLWISGAAGELKVTGDMTSYYRKRTSGKWSKVSAQTRWPADLNERGRLVAPIEYGDCIFLEWIAFLRAIRLGEEGIVTAAQAAHVISMIETSYLQSVALDMPWLEPQELAAQVARHWRAEL